MAKRAKGQGAREQGAVNGKKAPNGQKAGSAGASATSRPNPQDGLTAAQRAHQHPTAGVAGPTAEDKRRDESREATSRSKFPSPETDKAAEERQSKSEPRGSSKEADSPKNRARTLDEIQGDQPKPQVSGQVDHAQVHHTRAEHDHRPADAATRVEGPAPRRLSEAKSEADLLEQIRLENKADNLYFLRRKEREEKEPRQFVIDALNARLVEVQGEPILPE